RHPCATRRSSDLRIPLDRKREVPLYVQVREFLRESIMSGKLPAGTRLPASRQLARDLGVSRVTIETAYADLEAEGLIVRRTGSGSFVSFVPVSLGSAKGDGGAAWPLWQRELVQEFEARGYGDGDDAGAAGVAADILSKAGSGDAPGAKSELISFTGFGDPRLFRIEEF